jgi:hypothetical protein
MEATTGNQIKDLEDEVSCEDCPIKKRWPPIGMTEDEKKNMEKPTVRSWGPYG